MPAVLSQTQGPSNVPVPSVPLPVQGQVPVQSQPPFSGFPSQPPFSGVPVASMNQSDSESDSEIPTLALPFRASSAISENYLPMISTEDKWLTDPEYR